MNLETACASSDGKMHWDSVDWATVHRNVRRLQARIVKAWQVGDHGRAKALQWLLTHSFSGKALAVKRVTDNRGKRTPGVDGVAWSTPVSKLNAVLSLQRRGYAPSPLRRVYIPKANGKKRPLGIPTMRDRAMQALYLLALQPIAEVTGDRNSYGFRPERSTADALAQCFLILAKKASAQWILEGDIRACFDNICHDWMLANIPLDKAALRKWLKAGIIDKGRLFPTEVGTPQGGIVSPTLANMALDGLEIALKARFGSKKANKVNLCRYADDFVVTGKSKEFLEHEVRPVIERFLAARGLELSREKTRITHIEEGFNFLGWNFRKYQGKLLIKPNKENVKAALKKIRGTVKANKMMKQGSLIRLLNPILRGWANYHRVAVAKKTFQSVDYQVWKLLWWWARRKHPKKGWPWIKERYFKRLRTGKRVFATDRMRLVLTKETPIQRHVKIRGDANPFDPTQAQYFYRRRCRAVGLFLKGRGALYRMWKLQEGMCPVCQQPFASDEDWLLPGRVAKRYGGENIAYRQLLHPNCRRQLLYHGDSESSRVPTKTFVKA